MSGAAVWTLSPLWRIVLLLLGLGAAALWCGDLLVQALFPLWKLEIGVLNPHWRADRMWLDHEGADRVIRVAISLNGCINLQDQQLCDPVEPLGNASTLLGNATLPSALLIAVLLGMPAQGLSLGRRLVALSAALLLLWLLDVPLALGAAFALVWRDFVAPGSGTLLVAWGDFLQSGGRIALAIVLAFGGRLAARSWSAGNDLSAQQRST